MAFWTYTLTGFGDFFEQRHVAFAEPMPADRVCSICGRIPSNAVHLPCAHISCLRCKVEVCDAKQCPFDGTAVTEKELIPFETDACYLERRRVVCVVDEKKCSSNFSGKLSELKLHLVRCRDGDMHCAKCNRPVAREAAAEHYRKCCETNSTHLSATDARVREGVEEVRGIKEDLESLQQKALNQSDSEDEFVNGVSRLIERLANLDRLLSVAQETVANAHREGDQSSKPPAPGPLRAASKPGTCFTTCKFEGVYAARDSLTQSKKEHELAGGVRTLSGYTFGTYCAIYMSKEAGSEQVAVTFAICLQPGEWDEYVEWPCSKKVTFVVTHPMDERNNIRLTSRIVGYKGAKKPRPGQLNDGCWEESIYWNEIEFRGCIVKDTLFVKVEFE
uniref:Putative tumor necrosis factor receptor ovary overexpressed n=1 Tax=Rhipicephalus microplus TaxID=6941 RepID=A0A6M2D418_RHIMP